MGGDVGCRALLAALLWIPFLGVTAGDRAEDGQDGFQGPADANAADAAGDLLSRLGRAAWATLESWVGPQPLQLVAEVRSRPHGTHEGAIPGGAGTWWWWAASHPPAANPPPRPQLRCRFSPQSLAATLWIVSSGISAALTTLCGILGDLLAASGISGELRELGVVVGG